MQLELIASDQLRVRPSLQRGGLLPQKPLVVQVGLLGIDERYSCRYALNVSLYSEDDHLLDEATVTGTVPRGGEEVQRICLADSQQSGDLSDYDQEFRDNGQSFARNEAFHSSKAPNHNKASSSSREAPSGYKLKLAITYDGITRTYRSNWKL
ncbi:hypothetical protein D3C77_394720 [compost metagenome]